MEEWEYRRGGEFQDLPPSLFSVIFFLNKSLKPIGKVNCSQKYQNCQIWRAAVWGRVNDDFCDLCVLWEISNFSAITEKNMFRI